MSKPIRYYALRAVAAAQSKHPEPVARAVELIAEAPQLWAYQDAARAIRRDGLVLTQDRRAELFEALGGKPGPVQRLIKLRHGW